MVNREVMRVNETHDDLRVWPISAAKISAGRPQHLVHLPTVLGDHLRRGPVAALAAVGLRLADPIP